MGAILRGKTTVATGKMNVVVRFFKPGTQIEVLKKSTFSDSSGNFTVPDIPSGILDVAIRFPFSLSKKVDNQVFVEGKTTTIDFGAPYLGDLVVDDHIGADDFIEFNRVFGRSGACFGWPGNWDPEPYPNPPPDIIFVNGRPALNLSEKDPENELYLLL